MRRCAWIEVDTRMELTTFSETEPNLSQYILGLVCVIFVLVRLTHLPKYGMKNES